MAEVSVVVDDPRFFEAVQNPEGFFPLLRDAMVDILAKYKEVASVYAPESDANRPGRVNADGRPKGYYERGRGWWSPIVTHRKIALLGEIPLLKPHEKAPHTMGAEAMAAEGFGNVAGYTFHGGSQQMHDRWETDVIVDNTGILGTLSNVATYSVYVQGEEQAAIHAERQWRTAEDSWDTREVQEYVEERTILAIDRYYNVD